MSPRSVVNRFSVTVPRRHATCPICGDTYADRTLPVAELIEADGCAVCSTGYRSRQEPSRDAAGRYRHPEIRRVI